jgi:hypothetical protein
VLYLVVPRKSSHRGRRLVKGILEQRATTTVVQRLNNK